MVKIDFQYNTPYGVFSDAIWFLQESDVPEEPELELLKQERLNSWIDLITKPSEVTEAPVEEQPEVAINN